jgi:hypothetical protein
LGCDEMSEIIIKKYAVENKEKWNAFIADAKNGHFMFDRNYMDYHSDRFIDFSLLFYEKDKLLAVMPASRNEQDQLVSHGGLTFGGIISSKSMTTPKMMHLFQELISFLKQEGIKKVLYKAIPYIYTNIPSQEDLYVLSSFNSRLVRRDVSSSIYLKEKIKFSKGRTYAVKKAKKNHIEVRETMDYETFMGILQGVLRTKYQKKPTHSTEEIILLAKRFRDRIKLFGAFQKDMMIAGVIVYENRNVAHTQYIAATDEGKQTGAVDLIIEHSIQEYSSSKEYFDFGISTEQNGTYLNVGLINQKEMFGARAVVHDFYELLLD